MMVNAKLTQPEGDRTKHYLAARLGSLYVVTFNVLTDTYACERLECVSAYVGALGPTTQAMMQTNSQLNALRDCRFMSSLSC